MLRHINITFDSDSEVLFFLEAFDPVIVGIGSLYRFDGACGTIGCSFSSR